MRHVSSVLQAEEAGLKRSMQLLSRGGIFEVEERHFKGRKRRRVVSGRGGVVQADEGCLKWRSKVFQETEAHFKRERRV